MQWYPIIVGWEGIIALLKIMSFDFNGLNTIFQVWAQLDYYTPVWAHREHGIQCVPWRTQGRLLQRPLGTVGSGCRRQDRARSPRGWWLHQRLCHLLSRSRNVLLLHELGWNMRRWPIYFNCDYLNHILRYLGKEEQKVVHCCGSCSNPKVQNKVLSKIVYSTSV